ncbi:hypothetical protein ABZZ36_22475 [Actinacidiphila glaucinigra]|uniref:hypothetical protein n=1 Tax=Actinacidiphila glaucinigra TaxID=235986 RepID=UPI0033B9F5E5
MEKEWPEGRAADPEAARERYEADLRSGRGAVREVLRADRGDAHVGLGAVVVATGIVGVAAGPVVGALVAGVFAAVFLTAFGVMLLGGRRRADAADGAYRFAFGWGQWL